MRESLDTLTYNKDFTFVLSGSGNQGKGEITQAMEIFLVSENSQATPTQPPPPSTISLVTQPPPPSTMAQVTRAPVTQPSEPESNSHFTYLLIILGIIFVVFIVFIIMKKSKSNNSVIYSYGNYPSYQMSTTPQ